MVESEQVKVIVTQQEEVIEIREDSLEELVRNEPEASLNSTTSMTTKISFGFTRQKKQAVVATNSSFSSRIENEDQDNEDDGQRARKRGVLSLEDGVIIDAEPTKKKEKKSYVIQVKKTANDWRIERLKKIIEEGTATDEDKARFALLLEAINPDSTKEEVSVPISGESQGNVAVLPSQADDMVDPDYNEMPVEEFGLAFLRGCGWKETAGIGKSNQKTVPLRISEPRPKGLGLGASISLPPSGKDKEKKGSEKTQQNGHGNTSANKERDMEEVKPLGMRSYVKCLGGLNKDAIGEVVSMDEENASVFVELSWPPKSCGKTVRMNQFALQVITSKEYRGKPKESRAIPDPEAQSNDRSKGREDRKNRDKDEKEDRKRKRSRDRGSRRGGAELIRAPS